MTGTLQILLPHRALADVLLPAVKAAAGAIMGGDVKVMWDADNEAEVELARAQFDAALKKGMAAFRVTRKGEKAEQIRRFDPAAGDHPRPRAPGRVTRVLPVDHRDKFRDHLARWLGLAATLAARLAGAGGYFKRGLRA